MTKSVKSRVEQLEKRHGQSGVIGIRRDGGQVKVSGTDETLTLDEFWGKYPRATLIDVVHKDTPPDVTVSWDEVMD